MAREKKLALQGVTELNGLKGNMEVQTLGKNYFSIGPEKCKADKPLYRHCTGKLCL